MPIKNALVIVLDDAPWDALDHLPSLTGHARAIAFPNSFQNTPLCAPTRASFFTGLRQRDHGVLGNNYTDQLDDSRTFATQVAAMGVSTFLTGKYENENPNVRNNHLPPGWHKWRGTSRNLVYQTPVHNTRTGQFIQYKTTTEYGNLRIANYLDLTNPTAYATDVNGRHIEDFITESGTNPWLCVASLTAPHDVPDYSSMAAPRHASLHPFASTTIPNRPSFNEADVSDKPAWLQDEPLLDQATIDDYKNRRLGQWRALAAIDEMLDHLLNTVLDLDETLVLVLTDNTNYWGEHRFQGKIGPHEEAIGMLLHAFHPDVQAGYTNEALVNMLDFTPTLCAAFGAPVPWKPAGRNLLPVIVDGEPSWWRQESPIEWSGVDSQVPYYRGIRTKTHKYVEYNTGEKELYDLVNDPGELTNLAGLAQYASLEADLAARNARHA